MTSEPEPIQDSKFKSKEDRVRESITILKKLKEIGIDDRIPSYNTVKFLLDGWIRDGTETIETKIHFPTFGRVADIILPKKKTATASLTLRVVDEATRRRLAAAVASEANRSLKYST